jgi:hypothetical protein
MEGDAVPSPLRCHCASRSAYGVKQFIARRVFVKPAFCACLNRVVNLGFIGEERIQHNAGFRGFGANRCNGFQAVYRRHSHIYQYHIRVMLPVKVNGFLPVRGLRDDAHVLLVVKNSPQSFTNDGMVIRKKDAKQVGCVHCLSFISGENKQNRYRPRAGQQRSIPQQGSRNQRSARAE